MKQHLNTWRLRRWPTNNDSPCSSCSTESRALSCVIASLGAEAQWATEALLGNEALTGKPNPLIYWQLRGRGSVGGWGRGVGGQKKKWVIAKKIKERNHKMFLHHCSLNAQFKNCNYEPVFSLPKKCSGIAAPAAHLSPRHCVISHLIYNCD